MSRHLSASVRPALICSILALCVGATAAQSGGSVVTDGVPIPPVNDECSSATPLALGVNAATSLNATFDGAGSCNGGNQNVWFTFTPAATDLYSFLITGTAETVVAGIYRGTCGSLLPVACELGHSAYGPELTAGQTYYVEVSDWQASGAFSVDVATYVPPSNDACSAAAVAVVGSNTGTVAGASYDGDFEDDCNDDESNVWFLFTPPTSGPYQFAVTTGTAIIEGVSTGVCGATTPVSCPANPTLRLDALTAGVTYFVEVSDWQTSSSFTLDITALTVAPGDACSTALPVFVGSNAVDNSAATFIGAAGVCNDVDLNVWFTFVPSATGAYSFSISGSPSALIDSVSSGTCGALTPLGCPFTASAAFDLLTAGVVYYIEVGDWQNSGPFMLDIAPYTPAVPGDACSTALVAGVGANLGSTVGATFVGGGECNDLTPNVWWTFTPPTTSAYAIELVGGATHEISAVYVGSCGALNPLVCVERERTAALLTAGVTYYVEVADWGGNGGSAYSLDINPFVPLPNDECTGAIPAQLGVTTGVNGFLATSSAGFPCDVSLDLWYSFTPTCTGGYVFSTCGLSLNDDVDDTVIAVYAACGTTPLACDDDSCGSESLVTVDLVAGQTYLIRVGGFEERVAVTGLRIARSEPFAISFATAPGSVTMSIANGTPFGLYFAPLTFSGANYPNGSFFGIDISFLDLLAQAGAGAPFLGALDVCGATTQGPYLGVPPGLTLYSVALDNLGAPFLSPSAPTTFTTL